MIIIAHRGNLAGPNRDLENLPKHILTVLAARLDVEIDVWRIGSQWFSGHDGPTYKLDPALLEYKGLWIHCKNREALSFLSECHDVNCFWHQEDIYTLTSQRYIWTYPRMALPDHRGIAVMPEHNNAWDISQAAGVCTDFPLLYREKLCLTS